MKHHPNEAEANAVDPEVGAAEAAVVGQSSRLP